MIRKVEFADDSYVLSDRLKTLLQKNKILLENERLDYLFQVVYDSKTDTVQEITQAYIDIAVLTKLLYDVGVDVLHEVTKIYPHMFTALNVDDTDVELPANIKTICNAGFSDSNITRLVVPATTKYFGNGAFSFMKSLVELDMSKNRQCWIINNDLFFEDSELTTIYLPETIASLGKKLFYKNPKLTRLVFPGTKASWRKIKKDPSWHNDCNLTEVECNDGVVKLKYK